MRHSSLNWVTSLNTGPVVFHFARAKYKEKANAVGAPWKKKARFGAV